MPFRSLSFMLGTVSALALQAGVAAQAQEAAPAPTPIKADAIVVTASPLAKTPEELASPVEVLDRDEILNGNTATLGELLDGEPGITSSSFARGAGRPIIRGLDNFRVRVQENGLANQGASALSEDHGTPIDPLSAEKIEVIRGPAVLRYGSQAIGGAVNVINNRIPTSIPENTVTGEAHGKISSVDDGHEESLILDAGAENIAIHADAFNRRTEDYDTPQGKQDNTYTDSQGYAFGGSVIEDWGYIGASVSRYDSEYGIPAGHGHAGHGHGDIAIDMTQTRYNVDSELDNILGLGETLRLSGGYSDYEHDEFDLEHGDIGSTFKNEEKEARFEFVHPEIGPFEGAIGMQWYDQDLSASGEGGELIAPAETRQMALFIFEETPLTDRVTLQFGGRIEDAEVKGTALDTATDTEFAASRDFTPVSGSIGLVTALGDGFTLGTTLQAVERAPDALELFSKGPHEATETFELGDPNLGKETAYSAEISLRRSTGAFTFESALFYTQYKDFIYKRLTGETCDDDFASCTPVGAGSELTQVAYSQDDATFHGVEFAAEWDAFSVWNGTLGFDGQFDYVRAELDQGGNVPRIPPIRFGAGVFYEDEALFGRVGFLRASEQDDLATFETETAGYTLLNADLKYRLPLAASRLALDLGLEGRNLLDDDVRNHVSFKKDEVLLPGRDVRLTLTARF
ncbi:TonB-dependent receptor [Tepidicaulis sp. LMO-SS28]|uniref:TonB-dependent receptor n=1 Tax=Tepidicaulis sp. LMO-SS28 TaxID=3447455 RepID=UPI003EDFD466